MRGRNVDPEDAFGEVMVEVNTLSRTLYDQRLEALEAGALLQKIIADVDIAVFAFDAATALALVNSAGEACSAERARALQGRSAEELGLARDARRAVGPHRRARRFPAAAAAGRFAAAASAKAASRTSCSSSRSCRARCAKKSARRGSASCASSATSSTARSRRSSRWRAPCASSSAASRCPTTGATTRRPGSRSFTTARSRSSASWARTRGSRGCRRRRAATPSSRRSCAASRRCTSKRIAVEPGPTVHAHRSTPIRSSRCSSI